LKVVILGCGRTGSTIASDLCREGHAVTIIDQNPDQFKRLAPDFCGRTMVGNGLDEDTLAKANTGDADAYVAVTNGDNRNIMSVQIAKVRFKVPKVVARIYDPNRAYEYAQMGIETVCTTVVGAGMVRDVVLNKPFHTIADYLAAAHTEQNAGVHNE